MIADHFTYHVAPGTLDGPGVNIFFSKLGFEEVPVRDPHEHGWNVRWFKPVMWPDERMMYHPIIHLVEGSSDFGAQDRLALGHFCVVVSPAAYGLLKRSLWCVRDSGSGRIWLEFSNLRVEVRSR